MIKLVTVPALALFGSVIGPAALACDMHSSGDNFFLSYIDYRDMTEAEQRAAEQRAIEQYHAQQSETARSRFVSRFKPDPVPEKAGSSDQQTF